MNPNPMMPIVFPLSSSGHPGQPSPVKWLRSKKRLSVWNSRSETAMRFTRLSIEADGVFCDRGVLRPGRVHHRDAARGRARHVDVVPTRTRDADHLEHGARRERHPR